MMTTHSRLSGSRRAARAALAALLAATVMGTAAPASFAQPACSVEEQARATAQQATLNAIREVEAQLVAQLDQALTVATAEAGQAEAQGMLNPGTSAWLGQTQQTLLGAGLQEAKTATTLPALGDAVGRMLASDTAAATLDQIQEVAPSLSVVPAAHVAANSILLMRNVNTQLQSLQRTASPCSGS